MTTTEPEPTPTDAAEPLGDEAGEDVQLVRTGWVRCTVAGQQYRLRPPFFGEFKRLRLSFEELQDALAEKSEESEIIAAELVEQAEALRTRKDVPAAERVRAMRSLRAASTDVARQLNTLREDQLHRWWADVFRTLCVDLDRIDWLDDADKMPAWMMAPLLPTKVQTHWRAAPLGRG